MKNPFSITQQHTLVEIKPSPYQIMSREEQRLLFIFNSKGYVLIKSFNISAF